MRRSKSNIFISRRKRFKINKKRFITSMTIVVVCIFTVGIFLNKFIKKRSTAVIASKKSNTDYAELKKNESNDFLNIIKKCRPEKKEKEKELKVKIEVIEDDKVKESDESESIPSSNEKKEEKVDIDKNVDVDNKKYNYKEIFKDDLFLGDSITESLSFYGFVDESNVFAKLGFTLGKAQREVHNIVRTNPKNIYIMFGMNDILYGIDSQKFADNYSKLIHSIKEQLPEANIYIQSILPVTPEVQKKRPALNSVHVNEFNQAIQKMAKEEDVHYLNVVSILNEKDDLHEPDGIHFKCNFYKLWLNFLIKNIK